MVKIFESCVPNVRDAWQVPSLDVDTLLVAIRIATYGHGMDIGTKCPKCQNEDEYQLDLRVVLEGITSPDYDVPVKIGDLEVYFKPMTYQELNANSQIQFEDQKLVAMFQNAEIPEDEKLKQLGEAFLKITNLTVRSIAQSIGIIKTPTAQVNEQEFIVEFLSNCEKAAFNAIRDRAIQLKQEAELKPVKIKCTNCAHEYEQNFTLDMSNFFDSSS
jgi:ribosomal protein S27E